MRSSTNILEKNIFSNQVAEVGVNEDLLAKTTLNFSYKVAAHLLKYKSAEEAVDKSVVFIPTTEF